MIVPFGFSVGDFIAAIQLTKDIVAGLKDQGGAADECRYILDELENSGLIFQYLESILLPEKYASEEKAIVAHAQGLDSLVKTFKKTLESYSSALTRQRGRNIARTLVRRTRWATTMPKRIAQYRIQIHAKTLALQLLLTKINIEVSVQGFLSAELQRQQLHTESQQSGAVNFQQIALGFEDLQSSIRRLEARGSQFTAQLEVTTNKILSESQALEAVITVSQDPVFVSPWRSSTGYSGLFQQPLYNSNTVGGPVTLNAGSICLQRKPVHHCGPSTGFLPSTDYHPSGKSQIETEPHVRPQQRIHELSTPGRGQVTPLDLTECHLALRIAAFGFAELLRQVICLYPHLLYILLLQKLPKMVPNVFSDDIILEDFFGQTHRLQYCNFPDWSIVSAMLKVKLADSPGLEKFQSDQFVLEVWNKGARPTRLKTEEWAQKVGPNTRIMMAATLSQLRMSNDRCLRCGGTARRTVLHNFTCSSCRISYRTWNIGYGPFMAEVLEQAKRLGPNHLGVTKVRFPIAKVFQYESYTERHGVLRNKVSIPDRDHISRPRQEVKVPELSETYSLLVDEVNRQTRERRLAPRNQRNSMPRSQVIHDRLRPVLAALSRKTFQTADPWSLIAGTRMKKVTEMEELEVFRRVSLRELDPLHEACLNADVVEIRRILTGGIDPDAVQGLWGTPLNAAVLSGSIETVELLLQHGANPLLDMGPLGSPIKTAAVKGYATIIQRLLTRALEVLRLDIVDTTGYHNHDVSPRKESAMRKIMHDVLDSALYAATKAGHTEALRVLLFYGANAFHARTDGTRPYQIAYNAGRKDIVELFIVDTRARALINDHEARAETRLVFFADACTRHVGALPAPSDRPSLNRARYSSVRFGDAAYFEDVVRERMARKGQWHYPYFRHENLAEPDELNAINQQYKDWSLEHQEASGQIMFEIPEIIVSEI